MGDPKKHRKKYETPNHPWEKERIEFEKEIMEEFGLTTKKEIWKMQTMLKNITSQIKKIIGMEEEKGQVLSERLVKKLIRLGLIKEGTGLAETMNLTLQDLLNRRLQTLVFKKEMAKSMKQARQFITHEHIIVGGKKVTAPGYIVPMTEEASIAFIEYSSLHSEDHPERALPEKAPTIKKKDDKEGKEDKKEDKKDAKDEKKGAKEEKKEVKEEKAKVVEDTKAKAPTEVKA
tara:strand:- start:188 stop:883 length:696 start_codon:yes stop_codon:yes gene_type:complete